MFSTVQAKIYFQNSPAERRNRPSRRFHDLGAWLRDHVILASLVILLCSLAPRLFLTAVADPKDLIKPDSGTYLTPALSLIEHGAFLNSDKKPEVSRTPGYPVFLAAIMSLVGRDMGGEDLRRVLMTQAVILSSSVMFLYLLARRILPPVTAFVGALLAAFSPWGAALAGLPLSDGLFVLMLALAFLLMKLVQETGNVAHAVWGSAAVGLLAGIAVLVRPIWPLVFLIAGALFLRYGFKRKGAWIVSTVMVVSAAVPLFLWQARNVHEAHFYGLSDISGKAAWWCLASRVKAQVSGEDRFMIEHAAMREESTWGLSVEEADQERWRRAKAVFREHPILTIYSFAQSSAEHLLHPSPDILESARLNFDGDYWMLALLWGGFLVLAYLGWRSALDPDWGNGSLDQRWLLTLLVICLSLAFTSGTSMGQGARLRAPLELVVPLLAGLGIVRVIGCFQYIQGRLSHKLFLARAKKPNL